MSLRVESLASPMDVQDAVDETVNGGLAAKQYHVKGSFPIVDSENMAAIRDGHVPIQIIERIVGLEFDKSNMKPAKYPHSDHMNSLLERQEL